MIPANDLRRSNRLLAVIALALVAYWPTFHVGFLWDDHVMIEANPALREWSLPNLKHDFTTDVFDGHGDPYYRPAQTLLNRVDFTLWKLQPFGYHLTNWIGHALNAILLMELTVVLGFGNLVALLVGCLFAVNPMPVEQLMIIAGRAEIFGFTFMLLSLLLLLRKKKWEWALGYGVFTVALLFKESAVITPALLACLFAYQKVSKSAYKRLLPFIAISIPYFILRHAAVGPLLTRLDIPYMARFYIQAFAHILLIYAQLIMIPWNLHSHRMVPHLTHAWPFLLALSIGGPLYLAQKKERLALLGIAWFVISILPKTPVMIFGNFMLDHWAYPASFGVILPLAVLYSHLWEGRRHPLKYWLGMTFFPLLIFWALLVHLNVALRGTDEKMYRWALHFTASNPIKYNLGTLLVSTGRPMEGLTYLLDYQNAYPEDPHINFLISEAYWLLGHERASNGVSKKLLRTNPDYTSQVRTYQKTHHP